MKIRTVLNIFALVLIMLTPVSCKKDKKTEYSESFSGSLQFDVPLYVSPGDVYELVPSGVRTDDNTPWGYIWTATPYHTERDTTRHASDPASVTGAYTLYVPSDTLCTMKVTCYAYAEGYYNTSRAVDVVIVDPEKTLSNLTEADLPDFTDSRDGKKYKYNKIGSYDWMTSNLAFEGAGSPFYDCDAMIDIYGMYYTYEEALTVCPEGWSMPDSEAWKSLASVFEGEVDNSGSIMGIAGDLMVDGYFNGKRLWEYWPDVKITNKALFYSLPTGYDQINSKGNKFSGSGNYAAYWTADALDEDDAYYMYIYLKNPDVYRGSADRTHFAAPVRCVRKSE